MKIIDISTEVADGMVRYPSPYLPDVRLKPAARHECECRSAQVLTIGTHIATHMDAPFHAIKDGKTIDQIPLNWFVGKAHIYRFPQRDKHSPLTLQDLQACPDIARHEKIVFDTNWGTRKWGTIEYFTEGPHLTREAAQFLADLPKLHLIGMDFPNIDTKDETVMGKPAPNHVILLGRGYVLLENLLHLEEVDDEFLLTATPLKLIGGDACPTRALAICPADSLTDIFPSPGGRRCSDGG